MAHQQYWLCKLKTGSEFTIVTKMGYGPQQAVESAGFAMFEVDSICQVVE